VDAESLALCAEGLLSRRRSGRIRSHLASCPECAAAQARLTEVPALLARVPPPPLPPEIAARLDAALSAEAARRAAPDPETVPGQAAPARPPGATSRPRASRPRGPRLRMPVAARVLAIAGVLVVAGGVGYAVSQSSSPSSTSSSSSAGSAAVPSTVAGADSHSAGGAAHAESPEGAVQFTVRHSGTAYRKSTLAAQAAAVRAMHSAGLNSPGPSSAGVNSPAKATGGLARQAPGPALAGCVDKVASLAPVHAGEVRLVDQARYQGHPATVIVVQASTAQPGTVYVAGDRCSASRADILATAPFPPSR
jgi:hypothetical protein